MKVENNSTNRVYGPNLDLKTMIQCENDDTVQAICNLLEQTEKQLEQTS
jgi:hypothetical protein